jgi:small subunit ribosomal protein S21
MSQQSRTTIKDMKIFVENNDIGKALRILKKKMLEEGVTKELRDRRHFVSTGEKKRLAEKAGKKRWLKKRAQLEQKFVREERNQFRKNKRNKNVRRPNQNTNQSRNSTRSRSN